MDEKKYEMSAPTVQYKRGIKKGNQSVIAAPVSLTREEIDFYAIANSIFNVVDILYKDASELREGAEKDMQTAFMSFYAKLKAASALAKEGEQKVSLGKDSLGHEWVFAKDELGTPEKEAETAYSLFLMWAMKGAVSRAWEDALHRIKQRTVTLTKKTKTLDLENRDLRKQLENAGRKIKKLTEAVTIARTPEARSCGRLQGKRPCRAKVSR